MQWAASLGAKLVTAQWPVFFVGLKSLYAHMPYGSLEGTVHEHSYGRPIWLIGLSFDPETRRLVDYAAERA